MSAWMKLASPVLLAVLGLVIGLSLPTVPKEVLVASLAGRIVNLEGDVTVQAAEADQWTAARLDQALFVGDKVRTGSASRAAILSLDESEIKLNKNTILILKQVRPSVPQVLLGKIWQRNKHDRFRFELETPVCGPPMRG